MLVLPKAEGMHKSKFVCMSLFLFSGNFQSVFLIFRLKRGNNVFKLYVKNIHPKMSEVIHSYMPYFQRKCRHMITCACI